jgi:hypothetical protein
VDCISEVTYVDESGKTFRGKFDSYLPTTWDGFFAGCDASSCAPKTPPWRYSPGKIVFQEDEVRRIPLGSKPSVWIFPGLRHPGGDKYLVSFVTQGAMSNQSSPLEQGSVASWAGGAIEVAISPVTISENADWNTIDSWAKTYTIPQQGLWNEFNLWCFAYSARDSIYCIRRVEDKAQRTFKVAAKLNLLKDAFASHGFMISRTANPQISTVQGDKFMEVSFKGTTTSVPSAVGYLPRNEFGYREIIKATNGSYRESGVSNPQQDESNLSGLQNWIDNASGTHTDGSDAGAIGAWTSLEKSTDFKPTRTTSVWFFRSVGLLSTDFAWLTSCKRQLGVSGVVSSNATVMKPSPPRWNKEEQSLEFKIASPHLDEGGKVAEGFYNLSVSRDVATCLWGKDAVNARATISVVNQEGEIKVFNSSYTVDARYLNFQIAGFTYSANTIKIRLDKANMASNSSQSMNKGIQSTLNNNKETSSTTITCVKGKIVKKVSAKTCPAGYKKR